MTVTKSDFKVTLTTECFYCAELNQYSEVCYEPVYEMYRVELWDENGRQSLSYMGIQTAQQKLIAHQWVRLGAL